MHPDPTCVISIPLPPGVADVVNRVRQGRSRLSGERADPDRDGANFVRSVRCFVYNDALWVSRPDRLSRHDPRTGAATAEWPLPEIRSEQDPAASQAALRHPGECLVETRLCPAYALTERHMLWFQRGYGRKSVVHTAIPVLMITDGDRLEWSVLRGGSGIGGSAPSGVAAMERPGEFLLLTEADAGAECHLDDFILVQFAYRIVLGDCSCTFLQPDPPMRGRPVGVDALVLDPDDVGAHTRTCLVWHSQADRLVAGRMMEEALHDGPSFAPSGRPFDPGSEHADFLTAVGIGDRALAVDFLSVRGQVLIRYWKLPFRLPAAV